MNLLALDTSTHACSVAVMTGDDISEEHVVEPRKHSKLLIPMIESVLRQAGTDLQGLDAVVLGNGPGSFIGMRIAASVAQGLAFGAGLDIVPVSSLAAIAAEVFSESGETSVAVAQDARMNEVYLGLYQCDDDGLPVPRVAESLVGSGAIHWPGDDDTRWLAAGEGWHRYPELLEANRDRLAGTSEVLLPRARYLLELGARGEALPPHAIEPAYLRSKVAEPSY